jgi:hypothetical protein
VKRADAGGDGEQMQIVIAQQRDGTFAEIAHEAQCRKRIRPAVDQIADEQEALVRR